MSTGAMIFPGEGATKIEAMDAFFKLSCGTTELDPVLDHDASSTHEAVDFPCRRLMIFSDADTDLSYNELKISMIPHLLHTVTTHARQARLLPDT